MDESEVMTEEQREAKLKEATAQIIEQLIAVRPVADSFMMVMTVLGLTPQQAILIGAHVIGVAIAARCRVNPEARREVYVELAEAFINTVIDAENRLEEGEMVERAAAAVAQAGVMN